MSKTIIPDKGDFIFEIREPASEKYLKFYNTFEKNGPPIATFMNTEFNFPQDIFFIMEECENLSPQYDPNTKTIEICYNFLEEQSVYFQEYESSIGKDGYIEALNGLFVFVFIHEIAHALIDVNNIPIVGNEEIAADQLATLILLQLWIQEPDAQYILSGPMQFFAKETENYFDVQSIPYWTLHPLGEQRAIDILCLAYGKFGPEPFSAINIEEKIPEPRLLSCPFEFSEISQNWIELLEDYLKPGSALRSITTTYEESEN